MRVSKAQASLLDRSEIPVAELSARAASEGKRQRPIYGAHKWFARRAGSAFRALIVGSTVESLDSFWAAYSDGTDLSGTTILDPFVGGGTSVVEGRSLGAEVIGVDIDPIACAVSSFELRADVCPPLDAHLESLRAEVLGVTKDLYRSEIDGRQRDVLHFFFVQLLNCSGCGKEIEAHPSFRLAEDADRNVQWVFCRGCHRPSMLSRSRKRTDCGHCGTRTTIEDGPVTKGICKCPACRNEEALIDVASRTNSPPHFRLFALEVLPGDWTGGRVPIADREFVAASDEDRKRLKQAEALLQELVLTELEDEIPAHGRSDDRLIRYGYRRYRELFNSRQLLHLRTLERAIRKVDEDAAREALSLAFSDHLATNCMLTCYAAGWRRLVPLFAVRAFRHIPRPVEINPWLSGVGRGTFPNAVRQVTQASKAARESYPTRGSGRIINSSSTDLSGLGSRSVDLVITDPPYFDYVDYSELADFYRPWLASLGLIDARSDLQLSLASSSRNGASADAFAERLGEVFAEIERVLKPQGRLAFTFRHRSDLGWAAVGEALDCAPDLRCITAFPLLAEGTNRLHTHPNTIVWDAVLVVGKGKPSVVVGMEEIAKTARGRAEEWRANLKKAEVKIPFREPDVTNLARAWELALSHGAS